MARLIDWPQRLEAYIQERMHAPFEWGVHDCCRFAAGAVIAVTGEDPMHAFDYRNELGAARLIKQAGSLETLLLDTLGPPLPAVSFAGRGDVVLADLENGPTVGVCLGVITAYVGDGTLTHRPTLSGRVAWRIA